jgi:hypothetical protein
LDKDCPSVPRVQAKVLFIEVNSVRLVQALALIHPDPQLLAPRQCRDNGASTHVSTHDPPHRGGSIGHGALSRPFFESSSKWQSLSLITWNGTLERGQEQVMEARRIAQPCQLGLCDLGCLRAQQHDRGVDP